MGQREELKEQIQMCVESGSSEDPSSEVSGLTPQLHLLGNLLLLLLVVATLQQCSLPTSLNLGYLLNHLTLQRDTLTQLILCLSQQPYWHMWMKD